ncbi:Pectate lyase superfamily protein [Carnobacterium iners]|uniref:Pectate lyase superfamily protein n=1 Tax=Carnobacterium iners TaxID=1073423 RepID=A0A1X7N4J9_9LACT|nr:glycosyl hydrolase family 28-related protein [Carnobacterium iners]SEK60548.1 Pectate lyase superfamily protein [Carnobacterium iners]SMH32264.1 Pectate lyase superfamily protein [Carnobacterium iners]
MYQSTAIQELLTKTFPDYNKKAAKQEAINETDKQFTLLSGLVEPEEIKKDWLIDSFLTKRKTDFTTSRAVSLANEWDVSPEWKGQLDQAMVRLSNRTRVVSVIDYGAVGDGITDCTQAFEKAVSSGFRCVVIPPGKYCVDGIKLPSYIELIGSGTEQTHLILSGSAPKRAKLLTNRHYLKGNSHIRIEGLTLDWNHKRISGSQRTASGGTSSSGLTLAHVRFALVRNVTVKNPGLHGVDVTSAFYSYLGDGKRSRLGSQYVWVDQVESFGFGDDGITTHHSDDILISNCFLHHPSGRAHKKGFSNSNGIEIDDGSQHVTLVNNLSAYCFGGIEIKAHKTSSAATDTQIIGHFSYCDNRSYNFRHIGHHLSTDEASFSAFGIRGTFLASYFPQEISLYANSTKRALVISAYQKVAINHFFAKAQSNLPIDSRNRAISIQYRASEVMIKNIRLKNYPEINQAIRVSASTSHVQVAHK